MIDTSKAVRPCVEELAGQFNFDTQVKTYKPLYHCWDIINNLKPTFVFNGVNIGNNHDGTFTLSGTSTRSSTTELTTIPIPLTLKNITPTFTKVGETQTIVRFGKLLSCSTAIVDNALSSSVSIKHYLVATYTIDGVAKEVTTQLSNLPLSLPIATINLSIAINEPFTTFELQSCSLQISVRIPAGELSCTFSTLIFDLSELANVSTYDEFSQIIVDSNSLLNIMHGADLINTINSTLLENWLWNYTNESFNVSYCNQAADVMYMPIKMCL